MFNDNFAFQDRFATISFVHNFPLKSFQLQTLFVSLNKNLKAAVDNEDLINS